MNRDDLSGGPTEDETVESRSDDIRQSIGPYRILQRIGEGGFGSVFEAEQAHPVRRRVALKIIKLGMDTEQVIARFEAERQALAMMDHPHIARVLDAGATPEGRPYFVMELVKGAPITEYCDRERLPVAERLKLFEQVCAAVQHAHTKGVIHRDLKPTNILVSTQDGEPFARVIDFGIAKATAARLTDRPLYTELHQMIGTPVYMSPEQAAGSADIDTRTDVYSLGVVLYELLTGTPPLGVEAFQASSGPGDVERVIREVEPPRPSTRVSQSADIATKVAPDRRTEPRRLVGSLRGELDWIVMKAIEKERGRRYETASGLAADLRRLLAGEPVLAAPPSASYRLTTFVRRHRVAVTAGALVAVILVAGIVGTTVAMLRAERQRKVADQVAGFMTDILKGIGPGIARGRDTALLKELVGQASARIERGDLKDAADAELKLRTEIGDAERTLAEYAAAERMLLPAVDRTRAVFGPKSLQAAEALFALGGLRLDQGRYAEAEPIVRESLEIRRQRLPQKSRDVAEAAENVAMMLAQTGRAGEGEPLMREAVATMKEIAPTDGEALSIALANLGYTVRHQNRSAEAEPIFREAVDVSRRLLADPHPYTARALNNLAVALVDQNKLDAAAATYREALAIFRRIFGQDHPALVPTITGLAVIAQRQDRLPEAEGLLREALAMAKKAQGPNHPNVIYVTARLVDVLAKQGKRDEADRLGRDLLAAYEATGNQDKAAALRQRLDSHFAVATPPAK
jgi:serine/threonine protein kinase/tetratricopeptide (TPR) repeat protein